MHRIDTPTAQVDKFGSGKNGFTNGDPTTGRRATDLDSDMWDAVQEEICAVVEKSGLSLNKEEHDQLYQAIVKIINSKIPDALLKKNNLSDLTDKALARANLQLKTAAVADVQTSKDDVTTGRVLVNGSAVAIRSVRAQSGATGSDVADTNNLPKNSVSFVYSSAENSPGITGSLLDFCGLNSSYNVQIAASYGGNGDIIKFRTYNGDAAKKWNPWYTIYHSGNKPTAADVGAVPIGRKINGHALDKDANVTSQDIFNGQAIGLSSEDLDTLKTPGIYYQPANANTSAARHYPENNAGTLLVYKNAGVTQVYIVYNSSRTYTRSQYSTGAWTAWAKQYDTANKPTANDVGSYTKAESDGRYPLKTATVIGARVGARGTLGSGNGDTDIEAPVGNFITGRVGSNGDVRYTKWYIRAFQINVNGTWKTITA